MKTKYIKIPVSERLPEKSGKHNTDQGELEFSRELGDEFYFVDGPVLNVEWWLEEKEDYSEEMLSLLEKSRKMIQSLKLSMLVHPDCEEGSEFDDYTTSAQETENEIEELLNKVKDNGK